RSSWRLVSNSRITVEQLFNSLFPKQSTGKGANFMAGANIMLVEDERIVAKSLQHELTTMGYNVPAVASSGEEALRKIEETWPDLVLMDIVLKGDMDGVDVSEEIRDRYDIPVVYLTAYADDATLRRAKITEPYGYLLKPYEEKELHTTI